MMRLGELVATSRVVAATSKRTEKRAALAELLAGASPTEIEPLVGMLTGDVRQGALGTGWAGMARVGAADSGSADADVADPDSEGGGDQPSGPPVTVLELDETLSELQGITGAGSQGERDQLLLRLFERLDEAEKEYVGRLIIGDLRQGALAGVLTDAVAVAAEVPQALMRRAAMLAGDLGAAAMTALTVGADGLEAIGLEPLRPVQPMLASTAESAAMAVEELGESSVEWKLDGIRIQVHRVGDDVAIFTRNLNDVTARLPTVIELVRSFDATALVLDGEVIGGAATLGGGFDDGPQAFQDVMSSFGRERPDHERPDLIPGFFDLLHLDGNDLIDAPLSERRNLLERLVGRHTIPGAITDDPGAAEEVFRAAVAAGHEGVMVKDASSPYAAGRRGKTWRKVKPVHTYDLAVLAAEWGHGRRQGWLSNLHLGARGEDGSLVMVGKTFKGLTDEMLRWQTEHLLALEVTTRGHTVWVRPELVVEVAIDGVQRSSRYPGGLALRFARVKHHRPDKSVDSIDLLSSLKELQ